ncbi:hypothetical protein [Novosphingobium album (ex Liu et al. 2023)]|uniref:STAS domain-containing protein n=1 Tax=Novosphingobium album (ex Liu et al. 2023) TaxID=3031130 RepID=A0ABT5WY84_9SPHN|nr:hypothetical protein [Novosphingobium album (ex Liu et al. 2023)]MDE8654798.1 hypothetical protein [Novosphingobium album (ex Liu et al. 2023)]
MSYFGNETRAQLRQLLKSNGASAERTSVIVDLACHAADDSLKALLAVVERAEGGGAQMMTLELALQLADGQMQSMLEAAHAVAGKLNLRQEAMAVVVKP